MRDFALGQVDGLYELMGEGVYEQSAGLLLAEAAALQIEETVLVYLPAGGSVATLNVVSVDPESGLHVDLGLVGKEEVLVFLPGVHLLGVLADGYAAVEGGPGAPAENALVEFAAGGVRLGVVDDYLVVHLLGTAGQVQPVKGAAAFGRVQQGGQVVSYQVAAHVEASRRKARAGPENGLSGANVEALVTVPLDAGSSQGNCWLPARVPKQRCTGRACRRRRRRSRRRSPCCRLRLRQGCGAG